VITKGTNGMNCIVGCFQNIFDDPPSIGPVKRSRFYQNSNLRYPFYWRKRSDILWNAISKENRE
jgi:hypothetical protein